MNVSGCTSEFYYGRTLASYMHWASKVNNRNVEPRTDEMLMKLELYANAVLNPMDKAEKLSEDYIIDILDTMFKNRRPGSGTAYG